MSIVVFTEDLTGTASQMPTFDCYGIIVQADPDNSEDVYIGDEDNQLIVLAAGEMLTINGNANLDEIWAKAETSAATVNFMVKS